MIDEYLLEIMGVTRKWFYENGRDKLPDNVYQDRLTEIRNINSGASLILCGFPQLEGAARRIICVVDENGRHTRGDESPVYLEPNFGAIGSGATLALAALHHREHGNSVPFKRALYNVREAMFYGSQTPGVGRTMTVTLLRSSGKLEGISKFAEEFIQEAFEKYGPKYIDPDAAMWQGPAAHLVKKLD